MEYEQMELDMRLDADRELEENVGILIEFAHKQVERDMDGASVRNRHEGYGILAQNHVALAAAVKTLQDGMKNLLRTLQLEEMDAINAVASIDNSLTGVVIAAVRMSAQAKRINDDLYHNISTQSSPIEDWMNEAEDGFEDAEDAAASAEDMLGAEE